MMDFALSLSALLGATEVEELSGGHQGRVFRVTRPAGGPIVAKVVDAGLVDYHDILSRIEVVSAVADIDPRVCRPLPIDGHLVAELLGPDGTRRWVTCSEEAAGLAPDPSDPHDAHTMGRGLAALHETLRLVPLTSLPVVAALRAVPSHPAADEPHQLIHGDFRADNLRLRGSHLRIFDLDDCGYGPAALDVALSLYVVLFDATVGSSSSDYRQFHEHFLAGYLAGSGRRLDETQVDRLIGLRVDALSNWLDDLARAPIGIRTSPADWLTTLRSFVVTYRGEQATSS